MRLSVEFAKLHLFLTEEEQQFLQRLSEEEEEMNKKHDENMLKLHQIITSLKQLILEIREKSQSSTLVLLQVRQGRVWLTLLAQLPWSLERMSFLVSGFNRSVFSLLIIALLLLLYN